MNKGRGTVTGSNSSSFEICRDAGKYASYSNHISNKIVFLAIRDKAEQQIYFPYLCLLQNVIQQYDYVGTECFMIEFELKSSKTDISFTAK